MSYKEYVNKKSQNSNVIIDIENYKECIQNQIFGIQSKKQLYELFLDLDHLSRGLNYVSYPRKNQLIISLGMQSPNYKDEYTKFVEWSSKTNSNTAMYIQKFIGNLKSLYFLNDDVSVDDANNIVDYKYNIVLEKSEFISNAISECADQFFSENVIVKPIGENEFEIKTDNFISKITLENNKIIFLNEGENNKQDLDFLKDYLNKYKNLFFLDYKKNRNYINENIRKMYLGKLYEPWKYEFYHNVPSINENQDLWKVKVQNKNLRYEFGRYRLLEDSSPIRNIELGTK